MIMSAPDHFNGFHQMKHNSAITCQNQLELLHQKVKDDFSLQGKYFGHQINIFGPRPLSAKSLEEAWEQKSLIDKKNFDIAYCISIGLSVYKVVTVL